MLSESEIERFRKIDDDASALRKLADQHQSIKAAKSELYGAFRLDAFEDIRVAIDRLDRAQERVKEQMAHLLNPETFVRIIDRLSSIE